METLAKKPINFWPGRHYWLGRHYDDEPAEFTLLGIAEHYGYTFLMIKMISDGKVRELSLADRGMPGHEYDDRPQQIWETSDEAASAIEVGKIWWAHLYDR